MTQEQKDWKEYGKLKCAWQYVKQEEPENSRMLIPLVLEARRKAYRWLYRDVCEKCKHYTHGKKDVLCISCVNSDFKYERYDNNWKPID